MKIERNLIVYTKKAENDLNEIYDYIIDEYYDIFSAKKTVDRIQKVINNLVYYPEGYPLIGVDNIRIKKTKKYFILYKIENEIIIIYMISNYRKSFDNIVMELLKRI